MDSSSKLVKLLVCPLWLLKSATSFLVLGVYHFLKKERKLLLVTSSGIKTFNLGLFIQVVASIFVIFVGVLFVNSFSYASYMVQKEVELGKLKSVNRYFDEEVKGVNSKLQKINEYLLLITDTDDGSVIEDHNFNQPEEFGEDDLSRLDKRTLDEIKKANLQISQIQNIAAKRIEKIEAAINHAGLGNRIESAFENSKDFKSELIDKASAQGGPLLDDSIEEDDLISNGSLEYHLEDIKFGGKFDYLMTLEKLVEIIPFTKPMKNYYISSGFGSRVDPITNRKAKHRGLDFVGPAQEEVYSPAEGKVILAGRFNDYGKAVVIDHGYGITTRYGHLSKVNVKKGDEVKRGQLIALQGNTGRSTGSHLHYEVRYKKSPLDPYKFIQAGEMLYKKDKNS